MQLEETKVGGKNITVLNTYYIENSFLKKIKMKLTKLKIISFLLIILYIIFNEIQKFTFLNPIIILFSLGLLTFDEYKNKNLNDSNNSNKAGKYKQLVSFSIVLFIVFFVIFYYRK
jgi:hypothetical protein